MYICVLAFVCILVSLPHGAMGCFVTCDNDILRSYSLVFEITVGIKERIISDVIPYENLYKYNITLRAV